MATAMRQVTLLSRPGCHLCDEARIVVARVCGALDDVSWSEANVDTDRLLAYDYGDRVPVVLVDGVEHGFWRVDESRLMAELQSE